MHISKWKKSVWKGCILHNSNSHILEKVELQRHWKDQWLSGEEGWERMNRWSVNASRAVKILSDTIMVTYHYILSKPKACTSPRVSCKVNSGLWVIMMCQPRFIHCNKCTTLVGVWAMVCMCKGRRCMGNLCAFLSTFLWSLKCSKKINS